MEAALELLDRIPPDVVLVDIGLPGISGIEGIRPLQALHPRVIPLVLTVYENEERIFDALCAGACGYLVKGTPPGRLLEARSYGRRHTDVSTHRAPRDRAFPATAPSGSGGLRPDAT